MRFLYKRQRISKIRSELELVMDVLTSDTFIILDLFWYSLIFTLLLFPIFPSILLALLFFFCSYAFFTSLYFLVFKKRKKKSMDG